MNKKVHRYVEALNLAEVEDIVGWDETNQPFVVVNLNLAMKFPERFPWKNDPKAMEGIKEASCGPFIYLVLFFSNSKA
jgi:hypothetical protein